MKFISKGRRQGKTYDLLATYENGGENGNQEVE